MQQCPKTFLLWSPEQVRLDGRVGGKRPGAMPKKEPRVHGSGRGGRGRGQRKRPAPVADTSAAEDTVDLELFSGKGGEKSSLLQELVCPAMPYSTKTRRRQGFVIQQ